MQTSGRVSGMEAEIASLQQAVLQAKKVVNGKLQDATAGQKQAEKNAKVILLPTAITC